MYIRFSGTAVGAAVVASLFSAEPCFAQSFKAGDQVEASPLFMNSKWESCEVTQALPGGDYGVVCGPRRTEYVVQRKWVRPVSAPSPAQAQVPLPVRVQAQSAPVVGPPTAMPPSKGDGACRMGARVTDRENRSGIVVETKGSDCRVKLDDGSTRYYLAWMLKPGGGATQAADSGALTKGRADQGAL